MPFQTSDFDARIRTQLVAHEGLRLFPYTDSVGKLTIGVGRNLSDVGISHEEAFYLLDRDVQHATNMLDAHLPWFNTLDDVRKAVLIDMCFNMGWTRLSGFHNTLAAVMDGKYEIAADEMLDSTWAKQVGARAEHLAAMMRSGQWPSTFSPSILQV